MTKSKFTRQPWGKTKTATGLPKIADKNGFAICHGKDYSKEADANFDLIAAAPEMYAILEEIEKQLLPMEGISFDGVFDAADWVKDKGLTIIRRILAKARGEVNQPQGTTTQQ